MENREAVMALVKNLGIALGNEKVEAKIKELEEEMTEEVLRELDIDIETASEILKLRESVTRLNVHQAETLVERMVVRILQAYKDGQEDAWQVEDAIVNAQDTKHTIRRFEKFFSLLFELRD